ncbi:flagellar hook-basal body complex protein [Alkalibacter sp. M17DMB]|nr:flagellar hook-basal body complex protein [Alkalibacter mobilis]
MNVLQKKQENNAANTANANTPGYKYQDLIQKTMAEYEVHNHTGGVGNDKFQTLGTINMGTEIDEAHTDFSQGILKETGLTTDLAISGQGFFSVELEEGRIGFTRNGNFKIDENRQLITQEGHPVLAVDQVGNTTRIFVEGDDLSVNSSGFINDSGIKIMTVDFADYGSFELSGDALFLPENEEFELTQSSVLQGYIENSNVNLMDEIVKMMEISREFESNQRALKVLNETLQKTVNEIGRN